MMATQPMSILSLAPRRLRPRSHHSAAFPESLCLLSDEIRDIKEDESEGSEGLTSQQTFLWLQGLFLFALVWTVAGTINTDSRKKFDLFFRNLIMGMDDSSPRPKSVKLTKNNIFPEKGNSVSFLCYCHCLDPMFQGCVDRSKA